MQQHVMEKMSAEEEEPATSSPSSASRSALVAVPAPAAPLDNEILFVICQYLKESPCRRAAALLRQEVNELALMPERIDWKGQRHSQTLEDVERAHPHISATHLRQLCGLLPQMVDKVSPPAVPGVGTLLGNGRQSLLRSHVPSEPHSLSLVQRCLAVRGVSPQMIDSPNLIHFIAGREQSGRSNVSPLSTRLYKGQKMHRRYMGHLAQIFCVTFDRTGEYILTGADDSLVKIWSVNDGRLLATLRGHSGHITDFSINFENTLLATASEDKQIRIWNLKTTAPVAILSGHTQAITSVRFCPLILKDENSRYLVSTGNDGCVCFWKWNVRTSEFDSKPLKFIERPKAGCKILGSSFSSGGTFLAVGSTDHHIRVYHVDAPVEPTKILEIEVHTDQVDSLQFSNRSLRFVSGSKDGTAHIWYYEKQEWKNIQLKMSERLPHEPVVDEVELKKIKVNMVGWNCDDSFVLTSASDNSLRVWDSKTGKLVHSLREHKDDAFVIEAHPFDPRLVMTGGHDGYIIVWDISRGAVVNKYNNLIEGQGMGAIYDAKWSRNGQTITTSDSHGHMAIIGFGDKKRHERVPEQVFFHTDYRPLVRDVNGYVIDEQTQCPPHQMPPPFLVDIDGNPHPTQFQRLVPGRENSNDDQLVPYISVNNDRGVNEVLQPVNGEEAAPAVQENPTIDDMIQILNNERRNQVGVQQGNQIRRDHDYVANSSSNNNNNSSSNDPAQNPAPAVDRRRNSNADSSAARRRDGDAVEGVRQPGANWQSRDGTLATFWMHRTVVKPLTQSERKQVYRHINDMAKMERDFFKQERRKRPPSTLLQVKENNPKEKLTRRKRRINQQRSGVALDDNLPARVRSLTNRRPTGIIDYENVEELLSDSSNEHRFSGAESWSESTSSSESESEEESDEEANWNTSSSPRKGRRGASRKRPAENDDEDDEDNYDGEEDENESEDEEESESDGEVSEKRSSREKAAKKKSNASSKHEKLYSTIKELPEEFKFPEWLSESTPKRNPYFPQIGDRVVYFKKGHQDYMKSVRLGNLYDMGTSPAAIFKKKFIREEVDARVLEVKYEVKPPRLVSVKLGVVASDGQLTNECFTVRYHDMPNVIDFIVLKQFFENGMRRKNYFKQGTRFRTVIDNEWFFGTIQEWIDQDTAFQCVSILYSTGETDFLSPWDIEPVEPVDESDPATVTVTKEDSFPLSEDDRQMLGYAAEDADNWPPCGVDAECERIIRGLESIMDLAMAEHFNTPVDLSQHPVYGMVIPYMIDLTTILNRLTNRFYRRKEALIFDISFIEKNALEFNEASSPICVSARMLTKVLVDFIDDVSCEDPRPIWQRVLADRQTFEAGEDGGGKGSVSKKGTRSSGRRRANEWHPGPKSSPKDSKKSWQLRCRELLNYLFALPESGPFRSAVDPIQYPDYNTVVDTPMDLGTVREQLMAGLYDNMREFRKDIDLIFLNSKTYNTDKRSNIYTMTLNMSSLCKERLDEIARHHKRVMPAKKCKAPRSRSRKPVKPPKKKKKRAGKRKAVSCSDLSEPGPSGLCTSAASEEAGPSSSGVSVRRRTAAQRLTDGSGKHNNETDDTDEDYAIIPKTELHRESDETEIEDNVNSGNDTDATEIAENDTSQDSFGSRSSVEPPSKRKKAPVRSRAAKRLKKESHSDASEDDDVSFSTRTPSRSSNATSTSRASTSLSEGYDAGRKRVPYVGKGKYPAKLTSRTRNGGVARVSYACHDDEDSDASEFDYNGGLQANGTRVSSRGRLIKFKGQSRNAGQVY